MSTASAENHVAFRRSAGIYCISGSFSSKPTKRCLYVGRGRRRGAIGNACFKPFQAVVIAAGAFGRCALYEWISQ